MNENNKRTEEQLEQERWELLAKVDEAMETPMVVLAFVWLALLIYEFTAGLTAGVDLLVYLIWGVFILHFLIGFMIAPGKRHYLRRNWLTAVALVIPAFRAFAIFRAIRLLRAARTVRSLKLVRLVASLNRGMRALGNTLARRGFGYVVAVTVVVMLSGAAGMLAFENPAAIQQAGYERSADGTGIRSYGEALWWTAMILTTMGTDYWPITAEGRILCWLLAVYAFAIFGYITATIASFFVGQDAAEREKSENRSLILEEISAIRGQLQELASAGEGFSGGENEG
jgi:voltage-gated potassium channel